MLSIYLKMLGFLFIMALGVIIIGSVISLIIAIRFLIISMSQYTRFKGERK